MKKSKMMKTTLFSIAFACAVGGVCALNPNDDVLASADTAYPTFTMKDGAAVKILSDSNGLRFFTEIGKADYNSILTAAGQETVTFGTLVMPSDLVSATNPLTLDNVYNETANTDGALNIVAEKWYQDNAPSNESATLYQYVSAVTKIPADILDTEFSAISYAAYGDTVIYSEAADTQRSALSVAFMAYTDTRSVAEGGTSSTTKTTLASLYLNGITVAGLPITAYSYEWAEGTSLSLEKASGTDYQLTLSSTDDATPAVVKVNMADVASASTYSIKASSMTNTTIKVSDTESDLVTGTATDDLVFATGEEEGVTVTLSSVSDTLTANALQTTKYKAVTLDKTSVELIGNTTVNGNARTGEEVTLTATVTDSNDNVKDVEVVWASDSETAATVSGGTVSALAPAATAAKISATFGGLSAVCDVKVAYAISSRDDFTALAFASIKGKSELWTKDYLYKVTNDIDYASNFMFPIAAGNSNNKYLTEEEKATYGDTIITDYFENTANLDVKPSIEGMRAYYNTVDYFNSIGASASSVPGHYKDVATELKTWSGYQTAEEFVIAGGFNPNKYAFYGTIDGQGYDISNAVLMTNVFKGNPYQETNNYDACTNMIGTLRGSLKNIAFSGLKMFERANIYNYYAKLYTKGDSTESADAVMTKCMKDKRTVFSGLCGVVHGSVENVYLEYTYSLYSHNAAKGSGSLAFNLLGDATVKNCVVVVSKTSDGEIKLADVRWAPLVSYAQGNSSVNDCFVYVNGTAASNGALNETSVNFGVMRANESNATSANNGVYYSDTFLASANFSNYDANIWNLPDISNGICSAIPTLKSAN